MNPKLKNQDMTLRCVIVDDEPLARELIKSYVSKTPGIELVDEFESAHDALNTVRENNIDIIFLDINMPVLNGIEFAALVPRETRIIYITAYDNYAVQDFRVNALDYMLKPVSYDDFVRAVGKAFEWKSMRRALDNDTKRPTRQLTVKSENRLIQMRLDSINYVEVRNDRVIFFRSDGTEVSSPMSMREIEEILPADRFMRVHRSFIVNLARIEVVERNRIVFGKTYIPVSEYKRDEFFARFR